MIVCIEYPKIPQNCGECFCFDFRGTVCLASGDRVDKQGRGINCRIVEDPKTIVSCGTNMIKSK